MSNAFDLLMKRRQTREKRSHEAAFASRCPYCNLLLKDEIFDSHLETCSKRPTESNSSPSTQNESQKIVKTGGNLNSFLGIKAEDLTLPTHFHLRVQQVDGRYNLKAEFLFEAPSDAVWFQEVNWRAEKRNLILTCSQPFTRPTISNQFTNNVQVIPLLKSHLQKCIRRGSLALAVRTTHAMWKRDPISLIRRLGIIAAEDNVLNPDPFVVLAWFTMALTKVDEGQSPQDGSPFTSPWLMAYAESLASQDYYESEISFEVIPTATPFKLTTIRNVNDQLRNLVYALEIRKSFGGSPGDQNMLHNTAMLWIDRFSNNISFPSQPQVKPYTQKQMQALSGCKDLCVTPGDWELACMDFHVVVGLPIRMRDVYSEDDWQEIGEEAGFKSIMWQFGSGLSYKKPWPLKEEVEKWSWIQDEIQVWPQVEPDVARLTKEQKIWNKYTTQLKQYQYGTLKNRLGLTNFSGTQSLSQSSNLPRSSA